MNTNLKRRALKVFFVALAIFVVLFLGRLTYGYYYPGTTYTTDNDSDNSDVSYSRKNYASKALRRIIKQMLWMCKHLQMLKCLYLRPQL
jgi:hypothetical protein